MSPSKTDIIVGPPGTGKTTTLMNEVDTLLKGGYKSDEICFVSFTKKAAREAAERAAFKFDFDMSDLPWFRTLHSLAFVLGGFKTKDMMGFGDYLKIAKALGLRLTAQRVNEDGTFIGQTKGDRILFGINIARVRGLTLKDWHANHRQDDIALYEMERAEDTIRRYKIKYGKVDFHDIIDHFIRTEVVPPVKVLFVDEAQDLQPLQWKMVEAIAKNCDHVFIAGDDDQAIFRWAGADVERFINLEGNTRVLDQSYRVPWAINSLATNISDHIQNRREKDWKPKENSPGKIHKVKEISQIDMSKGSWLLLGRNAFLLDQFTEYCRLKGWLFTARNEAAVDEKVLHAIRRWEDLRQGGRLPASEVKIVYQYLEPYTGVQGGFKKKVKELDDDVMLTIDMLWESYGLMTKKIWHEALLRIKDNQRLYLLEALKKGEKVTRPARITISTIHGVKGGEADNVVLCGDMARRTYREYMENRDDEHRVWYVGVTRAKENLYLLEPKTKNHFDLRKFL